MSFSPDHQTQPRTATNKSIDGFRQPIRPVTRASIAASTTATLVRPVVPTQRSKSRQYAPPGKKHNIWQKIQLPLILFAGTLSSFMIQTVTFGMLAIGIYGVYAIFTKVPSRTTFTLAVLSVAAVVVLLLLKPDPELAGNFSTYTFLLLVIGVFTLLREGRPLKRRKRSRARGRR